MRAFLRPERNKVTPLENISKQHSTHELYRGKLASQRSLAQTNKHKPFYYYSVFFRFFLLLFYYYYYYYYYYNTIILIYDF